MNRLIGFGVTTLAIWLTCTAAPVRAQKKPELADVLRAAGDYLEKYAHAFTGLAADESYIQRSTVGGLPRQDRSLKSEVFLLAPIDDQWTGFRNVHTMDARVIQPDKDQLTRFFSAPTNQTLALAREVNAGSATANLNVAAKDFNIPTMALEFLTRRHQSQSAFRIDRVNTVSGVEIATLHFSETALPRLIPTRDAAAASGRFWVDVDTGRVSQTELMVTSGGLDVKVTAVYGPQTRLDFWVPISMDEHYQGPAGANIMGNLSGVPLGDTQSFAGAGTSSAAAPHEGLDSKAAYSRYRAVTVDLSKIR